MTETLRLYNTLTRAKEEFKPLDAAAVRLYVCGPTVYDYAHIGNARPVIVFDVLFRLLRHLYGADHVVYARNITDVDDKINARAERDYPGLGLNQAIAEVTQATERQFHDDVAALGCLAPTFEPRATDHIEQMRAMIERLVKRGVAYVAEDHVLFSPSAMDRLPGAPRYGSLARRSLDEMLAGARVDVAPYKRDSMDFVLWKPSKPKEPSWPSPAGIAAPGRPGWHIECSAMAMVKLLEPYGGGLSCDDPDKNVFDIHGGGVDLVFPHHENEIAQSCCAFGTSRMANYWMHNGFLQVEGEKMSKSVGNFVTIRELLLEHPGDAIRLNMLRAHYRQPLDWTKGGVDSSRNELRKWADYIVESLVRDENVGPALDLDAVNLATLGGKVDQGVIDALSDDLNTPLAISRLHELFERARAHIVTYKDFVATAEFLGFRHLKKPGYFGSGFSANFFESGSRPSDSDTKLFVAFRAATANSSASGAENYSYIAKDYKKKIETAGFRVALNDAGVMFVGNKTSGDLESETRSEIEGLVAQRTAARARRDWRESDRLRDEIGKKGVSIKDNKDGTTTWEFKS